MVAASRRTLAFQKHIRQRSGRNLGALALGGVTLVGSSLALPARAAEYASVVSSVPASPQILVPGLVNAAGIANSYWLSDVHITNHNPDPTNLTMCYAASSAPGAPTCVQKTVGAGATLALDDVVLKTFNMPSSFGALFLQTDKDPKLIEVGSETYNLDRATGGTLGIGVAPMRPIQSGDILNIFGPSDTTRFRANLARGSLNDTVQLWWRLHNNNDIIIAEKHETLAPYEIRQGSLFDFFGVPPQPDTYVELVGETGLNGFAYATVIDNISTSSTYHPPLLRSTAGGPNLAPTSSFIITNAKSAGAYGSFWTSDLALHNTILTDITDVEIDFLQTAQANPNPAKFIWQRFVNGETRHYNDVLGDLLQLSPPAVGALHFQRGQMFAQGRTSTIREDGGTIGVSISQMGKYDGAIAKSGGPNETQLVTDVDINGIYDNQDPAKGILRRTNIIALNTTNGDQNDTKTPVTGTFTLYDADGKQIGQQYPVNLLPYEHHQWNGLAREIAGGDVLNARLRLHIDSRTQLYEGVKPATLLLATIVNNTSNNSTARQGYQIAVPDPVPRVTGEQYVGTYLDILKPGRFFLNQTETRCFLRGDCGPSSLVDNLAPILARGIGETWSVATFAAWMNQMTDGIISPTNSELCTGGKPFSYSYAGVGFAITSSPTTCTGEPGTVLLTPADDNATYQLLRGFLVSYVDSHPGQYGGNAITGPDINHDPLWRTQ